MLGTSEKLLVSWKGPKTKENYFVGLLSKYIKQNNIEYKFIYNHKVVTEAKKEGFAPFVGLKDLHKEYKSYKLFSVFERRLPNQSRNIFKKFINNYNLEDSNAITWEYLKFTKGKTATDNLSVLEPIYYYEGKIIYIGEIAGWSFTKENNKNLKINSYLILRSEDKNPKDHMAVEIIDPSNNFKRVGYIPKPFNQVFFNLLDKGYSIEGYVDSFSFQENRPTLKVEKNVIKDDLMLDKYEHLIAYK